VSERRRRTRVREERNGVIEKGYHPETVRETRLRYTKRERGSDSSDGENTAAKVDGVVRRKINRPSSYAARKRPKNRNLQDAFKKWETFSVY